LFIGYSAMAAAMTANICACTRVCRSLVMLAESALHSVFPAIDDLKRDLGASQQVINLSVSLFILFQGTVPILWSAISEIYGRKIVYIVAFCIFTVAQVVCGVARNQILFLVFRVVGAVGSSVGLTIGRSSGSFPQRSLLSIDNSKVVAHWPTCEPARGPRSY
jgi:MFS family permease